MIRLSGYSETLTKPISTSVYTLRQITLIACLATLSIVGRVFMAGIPNVQPSTMIIIVASIVFGIRFGVTLSFVTVVGSNLMLGFGIFTIMQVIAWATIAIISGLLGKFYKNIPHLVMTMFAGLTGFIFGFVVSLNMLIILGPVGFYTYWLLGIPFDLSHAVGNAIFYLVAAPTLIKILETQKHSLQRKPA